jgi:hypothetical protein
MFPAPGSTLTSGWGGIRTPGTVSRTPVFKTGALNHSATQPVFDFGLLAAASELRLDCGLVHLLMDCFWFECSKNGGEARVNTIIGN